MPLLYFTLEDTIYKIKAQNCRLFESVLETTSTMREMSGHERAAVIKTMSDNFDFQDEPKVGIFWYDEKTDELFGVSKIEASELQFNDNGLKTIKTLHKTWWAKQQMRAKAKHQYTSVFMKDYTQIPRGRIFETQDGLFQLMCGSWINNHIIDLIKDEFDLQSVPFEKLVDEHWEIGHGWSEEYEQETD
ncbi:MAG: hypothetical protein Pg6A_17160 [Termitinemataceae bacterium]|nr:MAG: hypothetical protein Pg6A_17160 [Termitinemataceae bacterium]